MCRMICKYVHVSRSIKKNNGHIVLFAKDTLVISIHVINSINKTFIIISLWIIHSEWMDGWMRVAVMSLWGQCVCVCVCACETGVEHLSVFQFDHQISINTLTCDVTMILTAFNKAAYVCLKYFVIKKCSSLCNFCCFFRFLHSFLRLPYVKEKN